MAIDFKILPQHGLVYVRYAGRMTLAESAEAFSNYEKDPHFKPGQKHLVDLKAVTDWERDYAQIMALQAQKADVLHRPAAPTLMAFIAPTETTQAVARMIQRSWETMPGVVSLVAETENEALQMLGLAATTVEELLQTA